MTEPAPVDDRVSSALSSAPEPVTVSIPEPASIVAVSLEVGGAVAGPDPLFQLAAVFQSVETAPVQVSLNAIVASQYEFSPTNHTKNSCERRLGKTAYTATLVGLDVPVPRNILVSFVVFIRI